MTAQPLDQSLDVAAERGAVFIDGPGVAIAMTADAALETADRLILEATRAIGQLKLAAVDPQATLRQATRSSCR